MIGAPQLYIAGGLFSGMAAAGRPVLSGVSVSWGTESNVDFDDPATLSCEVLLKPGQGFGSTVGSSLALLDDTGRTIFVGRIASLRSRADERIKGALLLSITAVDTLADLVNYRRETINWPAANASTITAPQRLAQLQAAAPAGWTVTGSNGAMEYTHARAQRWNAKEWLPLLDMHLRSTLARRHTTSYYTPGSGTVRRLSILAERGKTGPSVGTTVIRLTAAQIGRNLEWEKNPDDTITDVQLTSHGLQYPDDGEKESSTFELWVDSYAGVDNASARSNYGVRQLSLDVDTAGGQVQHPHLGQIVNHWIDFDTKWRPMAVTIADSRKVSDATIRDLLDVTKRGMAYAIITELPPNPSGAGRVEAYVTAGRAAWTGKKWDIELTLGRQTAATGTPTGA